MGVHGSLVGKQDVVCSLVEMDLVESKTTHWRLLWVTNSSIVYVDAVKDRSDWNVDNRDELAGRTNELTAWARPRSSLAQVALTSAEAVRAPSYSEDGEERQWDGMHVLSFADGLTIGLPLFGRFRTVDHERAVAQVIAIVTEGWSDHKDS